MNLFPGASLLALAKSIYYLLNRENHLQMAHNEVADPDLQIRGEGVWPQGTAKYDIITTYVLPPPPPQIDEIPPPKTANQYALQY